MSQGGIRLSGGWAWVLAATVAVAAGGVWASNDRTTIDDFFNLGTQPFGLVDPIMTSQDCTQWEMTGKSAPVLMAGDTLAFVGHPGGDFDGNMTVDLVDYTRFPNCHAGPNVPVSVVCEAFDCDDDGDVDMHDHRSFQLAFDGGP